MAWYTIHHQCGHTEERQIYGTNVHGERERAAERFGRQLCADCTRTARDVRAADLANDQQLPPLAGSERQVAWASTIRALAVEEIDRYRGEMARTIAADPARGHGRVGRGVGRRDRRPLGRAVVDRQPAWRRTQHHLRGEDGRAGGEARMTETWLFSDARYLAWLHEQPGLALLDRLLDDDWTRLEHVVDAASAAEIERRRPHLQRLRASAEAHWRDDCDQAERIDRVTRAVEHGGGVVADADIRRRLAVCVEASEQTVQARQRFRDAVRDVLAGHLLSTSQAPGWLVAAEETEELVEELLSRVVDGQPQRAVSPEEALARCGHAQALLVVALSRLAEERARSVALLKMRQQWSLAQVADALGVSRACAQQLVKRGMAWINDVRQRAGDDPLDE